MVVMLVAAKVETKADELVRVKAACWAVVMDAWSVVVMVDAKAGR